MSPDEEGPEPDLPTLIKIRTRELLEQIQADLTRAYHLEALRSEAEQDNDSSSARLITDLKAVRGILRTRLKEEA